MEKIRDLMMEANCEICKQREADKYVNIGLDLGYTMGKYGDTPMKIYYRVKPQCVAICSLYLCSECEKKIREGKYAYINVLPQLKKLIKKDLTKQAIIEALT
jgi:hypothetical protein